jgi:hypothetical protein
MVMEVDQADVLKSDYPDGFFDVPETSNGFICPDLRRPYAINTPQPPQQDSSIAVIDVRLQGVIMPSGRVLGLMPVDQTHPGLNEEAVKLVSTWTYTPATCSGKPVGYATMFTVHLKGR